MLPFLITPLSLTLAQAVSVEPALIAGLIQPPTKAGSGDLALPCFQIAKAAKMNPAQTAQTLAAAANEHHSKVLTAVAAGPFVNLTLNAGSLAQGFFAAYGQNPEALLHSESGKNKVVCIDSSSPNIAKHLAFHHIRSTMIGAALAKCYGACGWKVIRCNFLGDWGTAFGRLIAGWKREKLTLDDLAKAEDKVTFLNSLYVRISRAADADPSVAEEARLWSKRLEDGDAEAFGLWELFRETSLTEFKRAYSLLGVDYDDWKGEAAYRNAMGPIIDELRAKNLLTLDQGAQVVDLKSQGLKKPCLVMRSDGGSLYATRDLAACDDRFATYHFDRFLYEVDLGQSLHFQEWFAVARLLGRPYAEGLRHVGHGLVLMWNDETQSWEKTATRKGVPMMLMDVLEEAITRAKAVIAEKNPDLPAEEASAVAKAIGVGAVVFNDLKNARQGNIKFRFDEALRFDGETGPYLQYAHARLASIGRRGSSLGTPSACSGTVDASKLNLPEEKNVLLSLARLSSALERVVDEDAPHHLATALLDLAGFISVWLSAGNQDPANKVLCDDVAVREARLELARIARIALAKGLNLLGLGAPERM